MRGRLRTVLVASGLGQRVVPAGERPWGQAASGSRIGCGCSLAEAPAAYGNHGVFMALGAGGYVGIVRVEDGSVNVAAAFDPALVRRWGTPAAAAREVLAEAGAPALEGLLDVQWHGTPGLTRRTRPLARDRLFYLGDAAGYVEPFTGEGIAWASGRRGGRAVGFASHRGAGIHGSRASGPRHTAAQSDGGSMCAAPWHPACAGPGWFGLGSRSSRAPAAALCRDPAANYTLGLTDCELKMAVFLAGIGTAVPPNRIRQDEAAEIAQQYACETEAQSRLFKSIYRRAGVNTRHSVVLESSAGDLDTRQSFYTEKHPTTHERMRRYEVEANPLALAAAAGALEEAAIPPERVTHLVTVSCSGFFAPSFDVALIKQLSLDCKVSRTHVGFMGCHGLLNGLRVARAFLDQDDRACVLVVAVEMCSLHHQYGWDSDRIVANALFADGAAALVAVVGESSSPAQLRHIASGSQVIDDSEDAMSWRIGDHGFVMTLSPRVPELICRSITPYLEGWLAGSGLSMDGIGSWAVHPGGPRILSAFGEATGFDRERLKVSYEILSEYGNMSSPTVLFIIDRMRRIQAPRPIVALAFGPGLAVESVLLE